MKDLDDPLSYALDRGGMFEHIARLGSELRHAWTDTAGMETPAGTFNHIVIAAMGGSAAAADYFATLATAESNVPVWVVRGYELPAFVSRGTLVISLSYSGTTEEVLACHRQALEAGATTLVVTSGGELATMPRDKHFAIRYVSPPRAALSHCLAPLLRLGQRLGVLGLCDDDIAVASNAHEQLVAGHVGHAVPADRNAAKQLAALLLDADPLLVLAAEHLAPAGRRTKNQLAENAKALAAFEESPEATHNIIVGLEPPRRGNPVAVAFDSPRVSAGNRRRMELTAGLFEEAGGALAGLQMRGTSRLADLMEATAWGDHLSCYLALLRDIDPTPTPSLDRVRGAMAAAVPAG